MPMCRADDRLGHRGHADRVGADRAQEPDLRGRLVARSVQRRVDAVRERRRRELAAASSAICRSRFEYASVMSGNRGPNRSSFGPNERVAAHQVDVIVDHHQRARLELQVDAAGRVGQHQRSDAQQAASTRVANVAVRQRVPFVEVRAARLSAATRWPASVPTTSVPAWPTTADAGQCGISPYGIDDGVARATP